MTPSETKRLALFEKLVEVLEEEPAVTLMEYLPPGGWDQVATKADLAAGEERINGRFAEVNAKIDTGLADMNAKIDTGLADVNAKIDTGLGDTRNDMLRAINRQTYIWTTALVGALLAYFLAGPGLA